MTSLRHQCVGKGHYHHVYGRSRDMAIARVDPVARAGRHGAAVVVARAAGMGDRGLVRHSTNAADCRMFRPACAASTASPVRIGSAARNMLAARDVQKMAAKAAACFLFADPGPGRYSHSEISRRAIRTVGHLEADNYQAFHHKEQAPCTARLRAPPCAGSPGAISAPAAGLVPGFSPAGSGWRWPRPGSRGPARPLR